MKIVKRIMVSMAITALFGTIFISGFESSTAFAAENGLSITGLVFSDNNSNGKMDTDEAGLANFRVYLDANNNGSWESSDPSMVTGARWNFRFQRPFLPGFISC